MSTTTTLVPTVGALWQLALSLWDQYATGVYTTWAGAYYSASGYRGVAITVGLPAGGTDIHRILALETDDGNTQTITSLANSPGWNATLSSVYPDTLPDSTSCVTSYHLGPVALRITIWNDFCNCTTGPQTADFAGPSFGVENAIWHFAISFGLSWVLDATGVMHGALTATSLEAYPTDYIAQRTPVAVVSGGGGGSIDLTPVVTALNDIATMDADYTANNGGAIWTMRGRVKM